MIIIIHKLRQFVYDAQYYIWLIPYLIEAKYKGIEIKRQFPSTADEEVYNTNPEEFHFAVKKKYRWIIETGYLNQTETPLIRRYNFIDIPIFLPITRPIPRRPIIDFIAACKLIEIEESKLKIDQKHGV